MREGIQQEVKDRFQAVKEKCHVLSMLPDFDVAYPSK